MPKLNVNGGSIYYTVQGQGEPMVMLRGLGRSIRHWLGFEKKMAEHFQVICIDARGIGRSTAIPPLMLSTEDMAEDVVRVLDKIGVESSHVFGVSLGGMVALTLGMKFGDRVRSLSVVNSSIGGERRLRLSPAAAKTILSGVISGGNLHEQLAELLTGSAATPAKKKSLAQRWAKIEEIEGRPVATVIKQIGAALRFRNRAALSSINSPTLIVGGTADRFVPPAQSEIIHSLIPRSQLVQIEAGGHEVTDDFPDDVIKAVVGFVESNRRDA